MTNSLSDSLRKAIAECGYSNYQLSKLSGVSQAVLSRFTTGERDITLETASKLAIVLKAELRISKGR
jgi:plasmid maintenance system antidote protein VapI